MRSIYLGHAFLVCLLVQVFLTNAVPQGSWRQSPPWSAGQLSQIPSQNQIPSQSQSVGQQINCGQCPAGTFREQVSGPYCGRCLPIGQSCAAGYYMNGYGQCQPCPCPETGGSRKFGTTCRVDVDGQVTCDCPSEYTGRNCNECAPGTIQNNRPPYDCIRINNTNSFATQCPAGNICPQISIPQIVQPMPQQTQPICPYTQSIPQAQQAQVLCPYQNQTCGTTPCGTCPPNQCPTACGVNQCGSNCPITQCPQPTPPPTLPPWTPKPQPCPGPIQCPTPPPCPINPTPCPTNPVCPTNPNPGPCPTNPTNPSPCPTNPVCPTNPNPGPCPTNPTCPWNVTCPTNPTNPTNPITCPTNPTNPIPCPINPTNPIPCPINPTNPNPGPCPINPTCPWNVTCPINPIVTPCPIAPTCPPSVSPCPNPCPNPCQSCPVIPDCPPCIQPPCPPCPDVQCPVCPTQPCPNPCPNPCNPCPDPCQRCPDIPACPDCRLSCAPCPPCGGIIERIEPCICDPRGTAAQSGSECICKVNVQGAICDQCKKGYFGLSSIRAEGCMACFCSGLTDSCQAATYYRSILRTDRSLNCTIELTNEDHTVVYSQGSSGFSFDGQVASYNKGANRRLFWSLPSCLKGDRVTSYGGYLSFSRMCTGSGSPLGADHEVMLVGGSGATVFWTTFEPQICDGKWNHIDVLLAEPAYWSSWKGEQYRRATRADIMEVLADLQLILIRATFSSNTQGTSIRNVTLSSVTKNRTPEGVTMQVESCRCPTGYRGLSCESCAPGYYRDTTDMSRSVFGACKPCPCGKTSQGCHLSGGQVICVCKPGFSGPLCQDKEVITVTCDPFRIREVEGAKVDFTCSFTTNSKRRLLMRLGREGALDKAEETTSLTRTITLAKDLRRVACEVVDNSGVTWAVVYCAIELITVDLVPVAPPPRIIAVVPAETFICINETQSVTMSCVAHHFGQRRIDIEWRREGSANVMGMGNQMTIHNAAVEDSGTYICSASDGEVVGAGQVALMVRRITLSIPMRLQYPVNATNPLDLAIHKQHGGDYPNYPYQADAPAGKSGGKKIDTVLPGHPKAVVVPNEVIAKPGETVILRCNATGQEPLKFYWKSGINDYIPVHVRVSHGALIFRNLRSEDAGAYYCVAWNHLGQSTARATIFMDNSIQVNNSTPTPTGVPTVEILHSEITARPGENVNFQCRSNMTGVKYQWAKIGEKMPNSSEIRNDGLLTLYRVTESNKGTYVCTVTSPNGEQTTAQAVLNLKPITELLVPPRITVKPKSPLRVRTGSKVRLECDSLGNPLPNVTWVRSIDGVEKKLVGTAINKAIYEIKQVSKTDAGKYTCNAVNSAGKKSESMSLVIDDGLPCKESEFRCRSGDQCIPREDRCDSEKDCKDGSDESNCKGSRRIRRQQK